MAAKQPEHQTWLITAFGSDVRTSLPHANTGRGRSAAGGDEHLGGRPAECSRRNNNLTSGESYWMPVFVQKEVISTSCCDIYL